MANINYPSNPTASQVYTFGGSSWRYNGSAWVAIGTVGPQGFQGPSGPQGTNGTIGVNGSTGSQGPIGATGANNPATNLFLFYNY